VPLRALALVELVQAELEAGRHAEVAAAGTERPEQLRMGLVVGVQHLAVGGDQLGGQQVVDGQAVLADQVSDPAAKGEPADPNRAGVAEPSRQAVRGRGGGVLTAGQTGLGPGGAPLGIDVECLHVGAVEQDAAVAGAVAGEAVAAATDGQLQPRLAREFHDARDVGGVGDPDDACGAALVEAAVEDRPGVVVAGVAGRDHPTVEGSAQLRDRDGGLHEAAPYERAEAVCWLVEGPRVPPHRGPAMNRSLPSALGPSLGGVAGAHPRRAASHRLGGSNDAASAT
jgi:hypothetical protein